MAAILFLSDMLPLPGLDHYSSKISEIVRGLSSHRLLDATRTFTLLHPQVSTIRDESELVERKFDYAFSLGSLALISSIAKSTFSVTNSLLIDLPPAYNA